jgi:hypothetical protein
MATLRDVALNHVQGARAVAVHRPPLACTLGRRLIPIGIPIREDRTRNHLPKELLLASSQWARGIATQSDSVEHSDVI